MHFNGHSLPLCMEDVDFRLHFLALAFQLAAAVGPLNLAYLTGISFRVSWAARVLPVKTLSVPR